MEENFNREDFLFCVRLVTEGFNMMGYRIEEAKITVNARSLIKLWKRELKNWDRNMLESHLHKAIENDELEKFTVPFLLKVLKARYSPPRKSKDDDDNESNRLHNELVYLEQMQEMIIGSKLFNPDDTWRHLTLFDMILEACKEIISEDVIEKFRSLKKILDTKQPGHYVADVVQNMRGTFVVKPKDKDPRDREIINLANNALRKLQANRAESISSINNYKRKLNEKHRPISPSQSRSA